MKNRLFIAVLITVLLLSVSASFGQVEKGDKNVGATIGLWTSLGFSVHGEFIFHEIPNIGLIGGGLEVGYAKDDFGWWSYTYIPIFGFVSLHYPIASMPKLVPYARLGFGFVVVSDDYTPVGFPGGMGGAPLGTNLKDSYITIGGQLGARYAVTDNIWVRGSVGIPWIIGAGVDFSF